MNVHKIYGLYGEGMKITVIRDMISKNLVDWCKSVKEAFILGYGSGFLL
jgi:hypothetical protein